MEEYKDISRGLKMLLDKAEEMGWNWEAYIEPDNRRTYVEIGQSSPAGEDFSMTIDFDEENQFQGQPGILLRRFRHRRAY